MISSQFKKHEKRLTELQLEVNNLERAVKPVRQKLEKAQEDLKWHNNTIAESNGKINKLKKEGEDILNKNEKIRDKTKPLLEEKQTIEIDIEEYKRVIITLEDSVISIKEDGRVIEKENKQFQQEKDVLLEEVNNLKGEKNTLENSIARSEENNEKKLNEQQGELEVIEEKKNKAMEEIKQEHHILGQKQKDLKIYEKRMCKKYPNEKFILSDNIKSK